VVHFPNYQFTKLT